MSDIAIRVENVSKRYCMAQQPSADRFSEVMQGWGRSLLAAAPRFRNAAPAAEQDSFWALRDVSFDIRQGEVVGIIGRNGAGKSTLLKLLSRITEPTSGRIGMRGRVGSLLEVGTGFHPDLTGRENIYLNGAMLGMRRGEIQRKFDEIVAFAEIDRFLDTPVKRYSSGMYVRLGFAVAAHLEPEILIVDEVLAVGDAAFQKKCLGKMRDVAQGGQTVLFVTHNMTAARSFCSSVILLDHGEVVFRGDASEGTDLYLLGNDPAAPMIRWDNVDSAPGTAEARLHSVTLRKANDDGQPLAIDDELHLDIEYWNFAARDPINVSVVLYNHDGTPVFNSVSEPTIHPPGCIGCRCKLPADLLNDGRYLYD